MDAESLLIAVDKNNAQRPITLSQGTYGPRMGVPRIISLFRKYNIPTSFFIPGVTAERHPYAVEAICREGYEVGVHGYTHDRPDSMSLEEEEEQLVKAKEVLTRMTGQKIRGYISPAWEYSTNTLRLLRTHGFEYAADAMDEDVPYYLTIDGEQTDMVQLPINWTLDDAPLYWFSLLPPLNYGAPYAEPSRAFELWSTEFDALYEEGAYFHLTMHPFLSGRPNRIKTLERLIQYMMRKPGVTFCTPGQVVDMYKQVVSKAEGYPGRGLWTREQMASYKPVIEGTAPVLTPA
jgi:peptidoglycan/xylan/chitin deacetylase (PgdA/CDA1 family)